MANNISSNNLGLEPDVLEYEADFEWPFQSLPRGDEPHAEGMNALADEMDTMNIDAAEIPQTAPEQPEQDHFDDPISTSALLNLFNDGAPAPRTQYYIPQPEQGRYVRAGLAAEMYDGSRESAYWGGLFEVTCEHYGPCSRCCRRPLGREGRDMQEMADDLTLEPSVKDRTGWTAVNAHWKPVPAREQAPSPVSECRLPYFFMHDWTLEERQYLLVLRVFSVAPWSDIADAINRKYDFCLSVRAVTSQFDHICYCLPMWVVESVSARTVDDEVIQSVLRASGLKDTQWGPELPVFDFRAASMKPREG